MRAFIRTFAGAVLAGFAVLAGAQAEPASDADDVITAPIWSSIPWPTPYPTHAGRLHIPGRVVLRCRVGSDRTLINCRVAEETPAGLDFGHMALLAAAGYRIRDRDADGVPTRHRWVRLTIDFNPPGGLMATAPGQDRLSGAYVRWARGQYLAPRADYPVKARQQTVSGRVLVRCRIGKTGQLVDCQVASEEPKGWGFGAETSAGLADTHAFVKTTAEDGTSVVGRFVEISYTFQAPCPVSRFTMPQPGQPTTNNAAMGQMMQPYQPC